MPDRDPFDAQLRRLRQWRTRPVRDDSMAFIKKLFKHDIERPYTQVQSIVALWQQFVPAELTEHCRLDSLRRGVLKVAIDSSVHLYELDRLLRGGLSEQITRASRGGLRKVQLVLRGTTDA